MSKPKKCRYPWPVGAYTLMMLWQFANHCRDHLWQFTSSGSADLIIIAITGGVIARIIAQSANLVNARKNVQTS